MAGRLFRFFLLAFILIGVYRLLFDAGQRATFREFFNTLAWALLLSSAAIMLLHFAGVNV